jgi:hypothetical protein
MDLASPLEGILNHSEGMSPETRDKALKETIEYYRGWQKQLIDSTKEYYRKGGSYSEFHLQILEAEQVLLERVLKGGTTYQQEFSKLSKDPYKSMRMREKDPHGPYAVLDSIAMQSFSMYYEKRDRKAKLVDETIRRLYLSKLKKKKSRDPEIWRNFL